MSTTLLIWYTSLRTGYNRVRDDGRARTTPLIALIMQVALGIWTCTRLLPAVTTWRGTGVLVTHLWLTCLAAWGVIALFSVLAVFQEGLNGNEALLLATLPLASATRLRALYGLLLLKGCGTWLLWETAVLTLTLVPVLGRSALPWLALLLAGAALTAWLTLLLTLLILRFVVPHLLIAFLLFILLDFISFILYRSGIMTVLSINITFPSHSSVLIVILLFLCLALLPLASPVGELYLAVLQRAQGDRRGGGGLIVPGARLLAAWLACSRGMSAAFCYKAILNQGRSPLAWARLLELLILIALFAPIRALLAPLHLTPLLQVTGYSALLTVLMLIEYTPYAISSEGNRLALYLVLPVGTTGFLRARLVSFLVPACLLGLCSVLLFGFWIGLAPSDMLVSLLLVALILCSYVPFTVLGSALDEDLALVIEDRMQTLMQEELPITPQRLRLLGLTIALLSSLAVLIWKLPLLVVLPVLALLDVVLAALMWQLSAAHLARLLH